MTIHERLKGIPTTQVSDPAMKVDVRIKHRAYLEIEDSTAVTICAQWQSPGGYGRAMAELASTGSCDVHELLDDIHFTRAHDARTAMDRVSLDMLATWAINHPSRGKP